MVSASAQVKLSSTLDEVALQNGAAIDPECNRIVAPLIADGAKVRILARTIRGAPLPAAGLGSPHSSGLASINGGRPDSSASTARRISLPQRP
jgi:hypothetical protein